MTVPAHFKPQQVQATKDACRIAGIQHNPILIKEPVAAALAYGMDNYKDQRKNVLVFDFGGGTLDITIMTV